MNKSLKNKSLKISIIIACLSAGACSAALNVSGQIQKAPETIKEAK